MIPVVSAPCFLFFCFVFFTVFPSTVYMLIFNEPPGWFGEGGSVPPGGRPISLVFTILMPCFAGMFFPGVPIGLAWFISLKVAAGLANDDVVEVVKQATPAALKDDDQWTATVAAPAIKLATHTMAHLSEGWGQGTGIATVGLWIFAVCRFAMFLGGGCATAGDGTCDSGTSDTFAQAVQKELMPSLGAALAPLLIALDVAHVSSMCDRLLDSINQLRLAWSSSSDAYDVHRRTYPLLITLKGCNNGQGLGCMPRILAAVFCLVVLLISLVALQLSSLAR